MASPASPPTSPTRPTILKNDSISPIPTLTTETVSHPEASTASHKITRHFLRLPAELRLQVYTYVFWQEGRHPNPRNKRRAALTMTCRELYHETHSLLLASTIRINIICRFLRWMSEHLHGKFDPKSYLGPYRGTTRYVVKLLLRFPMLGWFTFPEGLDTPFMMSRSKKVVQLLNERDKRRQWSCSSSSASIKYRSNHRKSTWRVEKIKPWSE